MLGYGVPPSIAVYRIGVNNVEWIPIKEKIPEKGQTILVCGLQGGISIGEYWGEQENAYGRYHAAKISCRAAADYRRIIAWIPLPEPYVDYEARQQLRKIMNDYQFRRITRRRKK